MCGFPGGTVVKNPPADAGGLRFDPWVGKIPWGRKWQHLSPCLENPMDRGAWQATIRGVTKSRTGPSYSAHTRYQETVYQIVSYNEDCSDHHISAVSGYLTQKSFDSHLNTKARNFLLYLSKLSLRGYSLIGMTKVIGQLSLCSDKRNRSLVSKPRLKLVSNSTHENEDFWKIFLLFFSKCERSRSFVCLLFLFSTLCREKSVKHIKEIGRASRKIWLKLCTSSGR